VGESIESLRCVVSSSALLEIETKSSLRARLGCAIHECYGTSEIGIATTLDMSGANPRLNSVGRAAPGVRIEILDDNGRPVPTGASGEIVCETPMLFGGYFGKPDLTASSMWGDYFRTGDLGRLDEAGYLYFLGRKKETIISGGVNVYPADIEAALQGYPGIVEAAAFAVPDDRLGEVVGLAYVSDAEHKFDLRRLRHHCGKHLADFQQPHKFVSLPALPRNTMGKLTRHALPALLLAAGESSS
jgi:long-chain acyl-CoA synthetase